MSNLSNQLVIAERDELARGIRLLLASPLVHERGAPGVVRPHPPPAGTDQENGSSTTVAGPSWSSRGSVNSRLAKVRAMADASRPARRHRSGRAPFDRRRYVLLCVAAAELLTVPVTTIGLLADRVTRATATDPVLADFRHVGTR